MLAPARIGFMILILVITLGLFSPLITLGVDLTLHKKGLGYTIQDLGPINNTYERVSIRVAYSGRVPLDDFKIVMGNTSIYYGRISMGNHTRIIIMPVKDLYSNTTTISFKIAFYKIQITSKR